MSELTPSGLPAGRAERVAMAARRAFHEHLPLQPAAFAFAGVLQPVGNGTTDLVLAVPHEEPAQLIELAYALLIRACGVADARHDDVTATACGDALEALDDIAAPAARAQ